MSDTSFALIVLVYGVGAFCFGVIWEIKRNSRRKKKRNDFHLRQSKNPNES